MKVWRVHEGGRNRPLYFCLLAIVAAGVAWGQTCAADGVVVNAMTGEPVARAQIGGQGISGIADATGRWNLPNIKCGNNRIGAMKTGYIPGSTVVDAPAHDVKIEVMPQSVATGKVIDEYGDPVQRVAVAVLASRVRQGRRTFQQVGMGITDDLGEYRVAGLQSGKYIVCAHPMITMPNAPAALGGSCYPGPPEGGAAGAMEIGAGRETQVNFTLREGQVYRIRGTVTGGPKGGSIAISLQSKVTTGTAAASRSSGIRSDGGFVITGVEPGSYVMACDYWEEGTRLTARVPITVGSSDVQGVVVHMEPAFQLGGVVRVESSKGSAMPKGAWGLNLRSQDANGGGAQVTWSSDLQSFTVREAPAGVYKVEGNPPAPFYVKSAVLDGKDLTREAVPIARSGGRIEVVVSDDSGSIEGSVEDSDGQPVAGASVMASTEGREPRSLAAGADGRFRISGLPPGDYLVTAWNDGSLVEYADADWMNAHARGEKVSVAAGQTGSVKVVEQALK